MTLEELQALPQGYYLIEGWHSGWNTGQDTLVALGYFRGASKDTLMVASPDHYLRLKGVWWIASDQFAGRPISNLGYAEGIDGRLKPITREQYKALRNLLIER